MTDYGKTQTFFSRESIGIPFGTSSPAVFGDASEIAEWAARNDLKFLPIEDLESNGHDCSIIVCTSAEHYARLNLMRDQMRHARTLWFPLAAFHGPGSPLSYSLKQLSRSSLHTAHQRQVAIAETLKSRRHVTVRDRLGNIAEFHIPKTTRVAEAPRESLKPGDFISAVSYFEVETEYAEIDSEYLAADGELAVDCLLYARSARNHPPSSTLAAARSISGAVGASKSAIMRFRDGSLAQFSVDGTDIAAEVANLAGERLGPRLTEFSFGLNSSLKDVDWTVNSPLNEGALGVHVGLGDGYSGLHLDFVIASATAEFQSG
jgi:hypothetical protein